MFTFKFFIKETIEWLKNYKNPKRKFVGIHENTHAHIEDHRKKCLQEYIDRYDTKRRKERHIKWRKYRGDLDG